MLVASVIDPRYGVPKVAETRNVIEAAKKLEKEFFTEGQSNLKVAHQKKKERYPEAVTELAITCWETKATIPEPAQHARPLAAPTDGRDTILKRLQVLTDDEAYMAFSEDSGTAVRTIMKTKCDSLRNKHKSNTEYTRQVMARLDRMESSFPSKTWFLSKKPSQTKVNYERTTGLCKDCHTAQTNHETLLKEARKLCNCGLHTCKNWVCLCDDPDDCSCDTSCQCDDCSSCQVNIIHSIFLPFWSL